MKKISNPVVQAAYSYADYRALIDRLLAENKSTGPHQSPALTNYSQMNVARMRRLDKTTQLSEASLALMKEIQRPLIWLTITEGWCGDAAQIVPVLEKMAAENPRVDHRLILRDDHLDIMDQFLTNGGRSIPKTLLLDAETLDVLGDWGPRPAVVQKMVMDAKEQAMKMDDPEARKAFEYEVKKDVQLWYAKDKTQAIQTEFGQVVRDVLTIVSAG